MTDSPCSDELGDLALDVGLRADVDAAGRLVEDDELGRGREPAGEQHLLLVAAGEVAGEQVRVGRAHVERLRCTRRRRHPARSADLAQPAAPGLDAEHDVLGDGEVGDDALGAPVLGREGDAVVDRVRAARSSARARRRPRSGRSRRGRRRRAGGRARCAPSRGGRRCRRPRRRRRRGRPARARRGGRPRSRAARASPVRSIVALGDATRWPRARRARGRSSWSRASSRGRSAARYSPTSWPLRSTVMRSEIS